MEYLEEVAREVCRARNLDPDEQVGHSAKPDDSGYVPAILLYSPRWYLVAGEVKTFLEIDRAIMRVHHRHWPSKPERAP